MKKTVVISPVDALAAHELAALEIGELRRKGVPCHLEEHTDAGGHRLDIVRGFPNPTEEENPEGQGDPPSTRM